jgi:hypothetical protein
MQIGIHGIIGKQWLNKIGLLTPEKGTELSATEEGDRIFPYRNSPLIPQ